MMLNRFAAVILFCALAATASAQAPSVEFIAKDGWELYRDGQVLAYSVDGKVKLAMKAEEVPAPGSSLNAYVIDKINSQRIAFVNKRYTAFLSNVGVEVEWAPPVDGGGTAPRVIGYVATPGGGAIAVTCAQMTVSRTPADAELWNKELRGRCQRALVNNVRLRPTPKTPLIAGGATTPKPETAPARSELSVSPSSPSPTPSSSASPVRQRPMKTLALPKSEVMVNLPVGDVEWDAVHTEGHDDLLAHIKGEKLAEITVWGRAALSTTCTEAYQRRAFLGAQTATPDWAPKNMHPVWYLNDFQYTACIEVQEQAGRKEVIVVTIPLTNTRDEYSRTMLKSVVDALALRAARVSMQEAYQCVNVHGGSKFVKNCDDKIQFASSNLGSLPGSDPETPYLRAKTRFLLYLELDRSPRIGNLVAEAANRYLELAPTGEHADEMRDLVRRLAGAATSPR